MTIHILLVEDSPVDAKLIMKELSKLGAVAFERVETAPAMHAALDRQSWNLIVSDWSMPQFSALGALAVVRERKLDVPFIIASGTIGEETAVQGMRAGAHDYVLKHRLVRLTAAVERELGDHDQRARRRAAEEGRSRAELALRQSEEQLRQAQKMDAIGRLAGGVAHDFNNILSVILSYGELILDEPDLRASVRADVEEIRTAAQRAAGLTRQLLLFSRQQVVSTKVLDVDEVLVEMDKMLQRILGEDVELVSLTNPRKGRVSVDPSHLEQVIMNLVVNARDAMPLGGKLTIETANVVLDSEYAFSHLPTKPGSYVMLAVSDTGCGMDRTTQSRIFEPFFTTKEVGKGTGLGLSTVFGIVQQSGGNVWVYSELGHGTTFKVYFPLVSAEPDLLRATVPPRTLRGTELVLLVEDEDQVRVIVRSVLERQGYRVLAARDGAEALAIADAHEGKIDLLLTDVVMPNMSGPELARLIAVSRPETKVVCMSGYTDDSIVRHGILASGVDFLQKPLTPVALAGKIREVLDRPSPASGPKGA